jgi:hypothetical protein
VREKGTTCARNQQWRQIHLRHHLFPLHLKRLSRTQCLPTRPVLGFARYTSKCPSSRLVYTTRHIATWAASSHFDLRHEATVSGSGTIWLHVGEPFLPRRSLTLVINTSPLGDEDGHSEHDRSARLSEARTMAIEDDLLAGCDA